MEKEIKLVHCGAFTRQNYPPGDCPSCGYAIEQCKCVLRSAVEES